MTLMDINQKATLEDLGKSLKKFETQESLHKFKNTAIYHSIKYNYEVYLEEVVRKLRAQDKSIEHSLENRDSGKETEAGKKCCISAVSQ